jgi:nicotinamidase/pyrazinamidase
MTVDHAVSRPVDGDGLLLIDVQNDFVAGGTLAVPGGEEVVPVLNGWIAAFEDAGFPVIYSRDWHPPDHCSFVEQGGPWPAHCVQETEGADFVAGLDMREDAVVVSKAMDPDKEEYSDFADGTLAEILREIGVSRLFVGGLATDYCVRATVLDALAESFAVSVIADGVRAVDVTPGDGPRALEQMAEAGATIIG